MTHEEALNLLLSHACPVDDQNDVSDFVVDLHCQRMRIKARYLGDLKYEIVACEAIKEG
jgi:hypothetical protein